MSEDLLNQDAPMPEEEVPLLNDKAPSYPLDFPAYVAPPKRTMFWMQFNSDVRWCVYFIVVLIVVIIIIYCLKILLDFLARMSEDKIVKR